MRLNVWLLLLCLLAGTYPFQSGFAQDSFLPFSSYYADAAEELEIRTGAFADVHLSQKPLSRADLHKLILRDSTSRIAHREQWQRHSLEFWANSEQFSSKRTVLGHFYKQPADCLVIDKDGLVVRLNPVINFSFGKELDADLVLHNGKGIDLRGSLGKRLSFHTFLTDNQTIYPKYLSDKLRADTAVPYEGRYTSYLSSTLGDKSVIDYFSGGGYVRVQALPQMSISFGHGRQFLGDGLRSLMLSDYSNARLFLQFRTKVWKLQYQNLFTELIEQFDGPNDQLLKRKYMATHHLSIHARPWLNIGLFESVVFSRENGFDLNYLNPLILYRFIEHQLGSPDNVLVGLNAKALLLRHFALYGQLVFDEFSFFKLKDEPDWWANKFGIQLGIRGDDLLLEGLHLQLEWNRLRPYTYTHDDPKINYTHYNQPLAHPLGANLRELMLKSNYHIGPKLSLQARAALMWQGLDADSSNYGANIFLSNSSRESEYGVEMLQGTESLTRYADLAISYQFKHNCFVDFNATLRSQEYLGVRAETVIIGAGIRVNSIRRRIIL